MAGADFAAHMPVEGDEKRGHQFIVSGCLRLFEQPFHDRLMAGAMERFRDIGERLLPCPGSRVFLPTIGESGQGLWLAHAPQRFDEEVVLGGEVLFRQQHLTALIGGSGHGAFS